MTSTDVDADALVNKRLDNGGRHTIQVRVRYGETDQMGVVYHGCYLLYFEDCRTAFLRALGMPYADMERSGTNLAVVEARLRLRAPARYDDLVTVRCWVKSLSFAKLTLAYEIAREGDAEADGKRTLLTTGETTLAAVSRATGRAVRIPDRLRALLGAAGALAGIPVECNVERRR